MKLIPTFAAVLAGLAIGGVSARPHAATAPAFTVTQRSVAMGAYPMDVEQQRNYHYPDGPIESVINPGPCLWDADDRLTAQWGGRMGKGESISYSDCVIEDWVRHLIRLDVTTPLVGEVYIDGVLQSWTCGYTVDHGVTVDENGYRVGDPPLPEIEGSNGGEGVRVSVLFVVRNPLNHPLNNVGAAAYIAHQNTPSLVC